MDDFLKEVVFSHPGWGVVLLLLFWLGFVLFLILGGLDVVLAKV